MTLSLCHEQKPQHQSQWLNALIFFNLFGIMTMIMLVLRHLYCVLMTAMLREALRIMKQGEGIENEDVDVSLRDSIFAMGAIVVAFCTSAVQAATSKEGAIAIFSVYYGCRASALVVNWMARE